MRASSLRPNRCFRTGWFIAIVCGTLFPGLRAATPPLLARAIEQWTAGSADLAFTQHSRSFHDDGRVKEERLERYDPSLPDSRRWRLVEVDGRPASPEQREKWEGKKNGKPRKQAIKAPGQYLELEYATQVGETAGSTSFEIRLRPEAMRLLAVEKIAIVLTVDKETGNVGRIAATLRQPIRVLLGLARVTDLDVDVRIDPAQDNSPLRSGNVQTGSTARVTMSQLGTPMEYNWSDFRRVASFGRP